MHVLRNTVGTIAAAALAAGLTVVAAPTASAASPCWYQGSEWWCNNVRGAAVYEPAETNGYPHPDVVVGRMNSNPSWFRCRRDDGPYVGGPHPHRWVFTKADNGAWGYMKDTSISSETNPLPVC
ncbi:hypothetical protein [Streptomyces sp. NPDC006552]|uniref:hypothetical protein n=1 Tax=Streptomyces sp. NPDC006552 TaxID=3157179 RepID=UPI00339E07E0